MKLHRIWLGLFLSWYLTVGSVGPALAVTTLSYHGGPIMQSVAPVLVFWLPPGTHFLLPPNDNAATDQAYESAMENFFKNLSGTSYLNIVTQYPGQCTFNACTAPGNRGAIGAPMIIQDSDPYPRSPMQDSDLHNELQSLISQRGLAFNINIEFFIFTSSSIQVCNTPFFGCTGTDECAYHSVNSFNGGTIIYALMPPVDTLGGCDEGVSGPIGPALSINRETVAVSHELFESITDPQTFFQAINAPDVLPFGATAWWDSTNVFGTNYGNEIGDECNQMGTGVTLNSPGTTFVQQQWSNDSLSCVSSFGPSVRFDVSTGNDDLRGDSAATATLGITNGTSQTLTLKAKDAGSWDNNTTHAVITALQPPQLPSTNAALTSATITMAEHSSWFETPDNWDMANVLLRVFDVTGKQVCAMSAGGSPLQRFTGSNLSLKLAVEDCPPVMTPPATFNQIRFVIGTGGDDLRSDSEAKASLLNAQGAIIQVIELKAQNDSNSWANNTVKDLTFNLNTPQPLSALNSLVIRLISHNGIFETDDNWNVQTLNATVSNSGANAKCLADVAGNPFIRLTGSAPTVTVAEFQGC